jgi:hypothetical protein
VPDVVGNIRVDQASAQIMAPGHEANTPYHGSLAIDGHAGSARG